MKSARGFTLVEALVAVLVLSIGLLGIAGLQLSSLQTNSVAYQRTQATFLAYELLDRMRANRRAALDGDYDRAYGAARGSLALPIGAEVAERDLNDFLLRLDRLLPAGAAAGREPDVRVERNGDNIIVGLRWDDSKGADDLVEFVVRSQL